MKKYYLFIIMTLVSVFADAQTEPLNTARLSWEIPTNKADGQPLDISELSGYTIFITYPDAFVQVVNIPDATQKTYDFPLDKGNGDYKAFIITTDNDGLVSAASSEVETNFNPPGKMSLEMTIHCNTCTLNFQ